MSWLGDLYGSTCSLHTTGAAPVPEIRAVFKESIGCWLAHWRGVRYGPASSGRSVFEYQLHRTLGAAVISRASLLQAPVDKRPHGNGESCRQQEIKELIGRVNLHVRAGNELLICLEERKVLSQRWQVGSLEKKPAKLPFLGSLCLTPCANRPPKSLALPCWANSTVMGEGPQGWLHLGRALSRYSFSSCPNSCVLSRSDR